MHGLHAPDTLVYIENNVCLWFINEFSLYIQTENLLTLCLNEYNIFINFSFFRIFSGVLIFKSMTRIQFMRLGCCINPKIKTCEM